MKVPEISVNGYFQEGIKEELRAKALQGCKVSDLIDTIRIRAGLADEHIVPILGYLCRAFEAPLKIVLPVRELIEADDDEEPYFRALRVCFWFSANIQQTASSISPWNWEDFRKRFPNPESVVLEKWYESDSSRIEGCFSPLQPDSIYVRGVLSTKKDSSAYPPSDKEILGKIKNFSSRWEHVLHSNGYVREKPGRLGFWFDIKGGKPVFQITCCVEVLIDEVIPLKQSVV